MMSCPGLPAYLHTRVQAPHMPAYSHYKHVTHSQHTQRYHTLIQYTYTPHTHISHIDNTYHRRVTHIIPGTHIPHHPIHTDTHKDTRTHTYIPHYTYGSC